MRNYPKFIGVILLFGGILALFASTMRLFPQIDQTKPLLLETILELLTYSGLGIILISVGLIFVTIPAKIMENTPISFRQIWENNETLPKQHQIWKYGVYFGFLTFLCAVICRFIILVFITLAAYSQ